MRVLAAAVLTMSVAQLLDLATFVVMVGQLGPGAEVNPIVATMYGVQGLPVVAIAKVAMLALVTAILAVLARTPMPRLAAALIVGILAIGIAAGLVGGASNTAAIGLL